MKGASGYDDVRLIIKDFFWRRLADKNNGESTDKELNASAPASKTRSLPFHEAGDSFKQFESHASTTTDYSA